MTLLIDNRQAAYDITDIEKLIESVVQKAIETVKVNIECQVSIILVDNEQIKEINREFRKIDKPTDVLSFPLIEYKKGQYLEELCRNGEFEIDNIDIDTKELVLGDIVISLERADEQSREYGHSLKREIAYLTVHGILHLMGYDHIAEEDKTIMRKKEEEILSVLNIIR